MDALAKEKATAQMGWLNLDLVGESKSHPVWVARFSEVCRWKEGSPLFYRVAVLRGFGQSKSHPIRWLEFKRLIPQANFAGTPKCRQRRLRAKS
jgi:hypothetical protein